MWASYLVPPITRTATGIRDFQDQDIEALEFIKCFRSAGVSRQFSWLYVAHQKVGMETREEKKVWYFRRGKKN